MASNAYDMEKLAPKVVSLIVAIVVFAVVLVPIVDSVSDSGGTTEGEVLYTNTGDWYYDKVTDDTNLTITVTTNPFNDEEMELLITINDSPQISVEAWQEDYENFNFDCISIPIFTFKTADGRYGVEGIMTGAFEYTDSEYIKKCAGYYYRYTVGDTEPLYTEYLVENNAIITLDNGSVTYEFADGYTIEPLDGTYELYLTGQTEGEYTLNTDNSATVLSDTEFYVNQWAGNVSLGIDEEIGDAYAVWNKVIGVVGFGTVTTIENNQSVYGMDGEQFSTFETINEGVLTLSTTSAESGEGIILGNCTVTVNDTIWQTVNNYIVPTEIRDAGSGSGSDGGVVGTLIGIIPIFVAIGLILFVVNMFYTRMNA